MGRRLIRQILTHRLQPVQGDLARFLAAAVDVGADEQFGLIRLVALNGPKDGGVIASALDVAAGLVCVGSTLTRHDTINEEELRQRLSRMGTIDLRVDYLRPGRGERFTATSSLLRAGNKVAVARVELHNEEQVYIASATATYMVG